MRRNTRALAFGGIVSALCWTLLISTGLFPFMSYTMPAIAGFVLIAVAFENGTEWAYLTYIAVSFLCFIMATDIEAVILFFAVFGYYPTLRLKLQMMKPRWSVFLIKTVIFNLAIFIDYILISHVLGLPYLTEEFVALTPLLIAGLLFIINVVFWIYDMAVGNMTRFYIVVIRPKLKSGQHI